MCRITNVYNFVNVVFHKILYQHRDMGDAMNKIRVRRNSLLSKKGERRRTGEAFPERRVVKR